MAQTLIGVAPSASSVSRLNQSLTEQFEGWQKRPLFEHYRVVHLDGRAVPCISSAVGKSRIPKCKFNDLHLEMLKK